MPENPGTRSVTNLFTNPRFKGDGTWAEVRRSLFRTWGPANGATIETLNAEGRHVRITPSTSTAQSGAGNSGALAVTSGDTYTFSAEVTHPSGGSLTLTGTGGFGASTFTFTPGETKRISRTGTFTSTGNFGIWIVSPTAGAPAYEAKNPILEKASSGNYFDGSTMDASMPQPEDFRVRWLGTPNASESVMEIERVRGLTAVRCIAGVSTKAGKPAMRLIPTGGTSSETCYAAINGGVPAAARALGTFIGTLHATDASASTAALRNTLRSANPQQVTPSTHGAGSFEHRLSIIGNTDGAQAALYGDGAASSRHTWFTDIGLFAGDYDGPNFTGADQGKFPYDYSWAGTPDNSPSVRTETIASTETFWSVNGVPLQSYAMNITTWGGDAQGVPALRGDDLTVPASQGEVFMSKVPAARTISFGMWVIGANDDGTLPTSGSSRELFERNWKAIRKLLWHPTKQITLTKRFKDWDTGEIITASAKAQFAGGLTPTMNGTQRAQFVVQLRLTDPFFYSDEEEVLDVSAYEPTYTNNAINPVPLSDTQGYTAASTGRLVKATGLRTQVQSQLPTYIPGIGWAVPTVPSTEVSLAEDSHMVKVDYAVEPGDDPAGVVYGRATSNDIPVTPGEVRRFSIRVLLTNRSNRMRVSVKFFTAAGTQVGAEIVGNSTLIPKSSDPTAAVVQPSQWTKLKTANITVPPTAVRAQISALRASNGTAWRSLRRNYATDPSFESGSTLTEIARNLITNPQFESAPTNFSTDNMYINLYPDPEFKTTQGDLEVGRNYIGNPVLAANTLAGWLKSDTVGTSTIQATAATELPWESGYCGVIGGSTRTVTRLTTNTSTTPIGAVTGSIYLKGALRTYTLRLSEYSTTGTLLGSSTASVGVTGTWTRFQVTRVNTSSSSINRLEVEIDSVSNTAWDLSFGGAQVETGTSATRLMSLTTTPDGLGKYRADLTTKRVVAGYIGQPSSLQYDTIRYVTSPKASWKSTDRIIGQTAGVGMTSYGLTTNLAVERTAAAGSAVAAAYGAPIRVIQPQDVGKVMTVVALCYIPEGYDATDDLALGSEAVSRGIFVDKNPAWGQAQAPSTPGLHVVRAFITPTKSGDNTIRLGGGGASGQRVYWGLVTTVVGRYLGSPFSGSTTKVDPETSLDARGLKAVWLGTVNNSASALRTKVPTGVTRDNPIGVYPSRTTAWSYEGKYSMNLTRVGSATNAARGVLLQKMPAGRYLISAVVNIPEGYQGSQDITTGNPEQGAVRSRAILTSGWRNANTLVSDFVQAPATAGTHVISKVFNHSYSFDLRLTGGGLEGQSLQWGLITVVKLPANTPMLSDPVGRPFSGSSFIPDMTVTWAGTPNNSQSIVRVSNAAAADTVKAAQGAVRCIRATSWTETGDYSLRPLVTTTQVANSIAWLNAAWLPKTSGTYTLVARIRVAKVGTSETSNPRTFQATSSTGVTIRSGNIPNVVGTYELKWVFTVSGPITWSEFGFKLGSLDIEIYLDSMVITEGNYTGPYFDGSRPGTTGARWTGTPNASVSIIDPDILYANKVAAVESVSPYDYFSGTELDPTEPALPVRNEYGWEGARYKSRSILFEPNTVPDIVEVKGDYQTNRIVFEVEPPITAFTVEGTDEEGSKVSMTYGWGTSTHPSTINVEDFTARSGATKTSTYVDHSGNRYWFVLQPGVNEILTSAVGSGRINLRYRSAWL